MDTEHDIENTLTRSKPTLSEASRARVWSGIEKRLAVPSPFLFTYIPKRAIAPALIILVLVSTGGVALASETARPGDLLYPVDRAIETARLTVVRDEEKRNVLVRAYSEERLRELRAIIEEESQTRTSSRGKKDVPDEKKEVMSLEVEADVFPDITVVKVELNDRKTTFTTDADSREGIIEAVRAEFEELTPEHIEAALTIEQEDRASRPKDRGEVELSKKGSVRVGQALTEVVSFIDAREDDDDALRFFREIEDEIHGLNIEIDDERIEKRGPKQRFEWRTHDDEDDNRIEFWEGSSRVRIKEKNGEVRIDVKHDKEEDNSDDDWEDWDEKDEDEDDEDTSDEDDEDEDEEEDEDREDEKEE